LIYGDWSWEEKIVSENALKQAAKLNESILPVALSLQSYVFGSTGVNDGILHWGDDIPTTKVLKHVPGHTIMDNVFALNGTLFVVTDDPSFPPLASIASSAEDSSATPRPSDWQVLSSAQARETLGQFGGLIYGVSWLVTDASPSNYTLLSLWRTYSTLDTSLSPDALTLPPPRRVFYPNVPALLPKQEGDESTLPRHRSPCGFHPFLAKAAFPTLGLMFKEDWADYALLHAPYLIRRAVVADQGAARRARADVPPFAVPLVEFEAAKLWWEPIRRNVARFLGVAEEAPGREWFSKPETIVTYLSRQDAPAGPKAKKVDHEKLVSALQKLGHGYSVNVVPASAPWLERMQAIAQSTIVIGVYGDHMADSVYVPPSSLATVMEIFPPGVFVRDAAVSVEAVGVQYVALREGRRYSVGTLPPDALPKGEDEYEVPIDVSAVMKAIQRIG